jgi:hypothetical protein
VRAQGYRREHFQLRHLDAEVFERPWPVRLSISRNTVKTHTRNLCTELGIHRRAEAVERARGPGLPAPSGVCASAHGER